jgi:hypothetical protein
VAVCCGFQRLWKYPALQVWPRPRAKTLQTTTTVAASDGA